MKTIPMTEQLYEYVLEHCQQAHPFLNVVEEETRLHPASNMQISRDQGSFMYLLTQLLGVKKALEIGCFTGYSAISVASGLPEDGQLFTLDSDAEILKTAATYFKQSQLEHKINIVQGPALQSLQKLLDDLHAETFDLAFIDADKANMQTYYELVLQLLRPGGVILADNVLWHGRVIDDQFHDEDTQAIREFNRMIKDDTRVSRCMLHISDGLYVIRKNTDIS